MGGFDGPGVGAHGFVCGGGAHFSLNGTIVPGGAAVGVGVQGVRDGGNGCEGGGDWRAGGGDG